MKDVSRKVALFLEHASNPYMEQVRTEAEAEAAEHGLTVETSFADNRFLQIQQVYGAIRAAARPAAVAILPTHDGSLARVAQAALREGIDWICLHRRTGDLEALQAEFPKPLVTLVAPDQIEIGRLQGRLARGVAMGGNVLYVQGSKENSSTHQRLQGFREVIDPHREIVGAIDGNWTSEDAQTAVERWMHVMLRSVTGVDVVVCQSDAMAIGAKAGLRAASTQLARPELARVPVIGCDGLPNVGRRLVDEGELAATVWIHDVGRHAVRVVADRRRGIRPPNEVVLIPFPYPPLSADSNDARETGLRRSPALGA
jgi:ABC-type sugar transport system substrate-binding protein